MRHDHNSNLNTITINLPLINLNSTMILIILYCTLVLVTCRSCEKAKFCSERYTTEHEVSLASGQVKLIEYNSFDQYNLLPFL